MCDFSYINLHFPHSGIPPPSRAGNAGNAARNKTPCAGVVGGSDDCQPWRGWYIQFGGAPNKGPRKNSRSKIYEWCSAMVKRNQILETSHQGPVWRARHLQNAFHTKGYSFLWKSGTVIIPVVWGPTLTKKGRFWKLTNCLGQPYLIHRFSSESSCLGKRKYLKSDMLILWTWFRYCINRLYYYLNQISHYLKVTSCTATRDAKPLPQQEKISEISTTNLASTMLK